MGLFEDGESKMRIKWLGKFLGNLFEYLSSVNEDVCLD